MGFGRNTHVAKAQAAESKARAAADSVAHAQAWREAARQWERAAAREQVDKLQRQYAQNAQVARANADAGFDLTGGATADSEVHSADVQANAANTEPAADAADAEPSAQAEQPDPLAETALRGGRLLN